MIAALFLLLIQEPVEWKLKAGEELTYRHTIEQKFELADGDKSFTYGQKIEATEKLTVERVTSGGHYVMRYQVTGVKVSVDGLTVYDSKRPGRGNPAAAALFKDALGRDVKFVMSAQGQRVESDGRTTRDRFRDRFTGAKPMDAATLPMAVVSLPLPGDGAKEWSVDATDKSGDITILSKTKYSRDRKNIQGSTSLSLKDAPKNMKLSNSRGKQKAVFDGVLRESSLDFTVNVVNGARRVVNRMITQSKLIGRK